MVEWQPPKIGASCLKHYRVTVEPSDFIFNITETNVTIARLHACMMYHVHLSAVNENDDEGDTVTVSGETLNYSKCNINYTRGSTEYYFSRFTKTGPCLLYEFSIAETETLALFYLAI